MRCKRAFVETGGLAAVDPKPSLAAFVSRCGLGAYSTLTTYPEQLSSGLRVERMERFNPSRLRTPSRQLRQNSYGVSF
jgi:hypothetical protein